MTNKEVGAELGVSGEAVRQALVAITKKLQREKFDLDKFSWLDHDARVFRREFDAYCRKGIGLLYRGRQQPRMSRSLIPHNKLYTFESRDKAGKPSFSHEPAWTKHKKTGHCICMACCPTKLGPSEVYVAHRAKLSTFERTAAGWAPKKTNKPGPTWMSVALGYKTDVENDDDKGPQAWTGWSQWKRAPQPAWKVKARKTIKAPKGKATFRRPNIRHVDYKGRPINPGERKKPWTKPTCSTLASLCYSSDAYLMPSPPPAAITTAVRPPMSGRLLQRSSSGTA